MKTKIVIIGGVAAGASAAAKARRVNENAEISVIEQGPYISFANCGLPYRVSGMIKERNKLLIVSPEFFKKRFNINVFIEHKAISINREEKFITVEDLKNNQLKKFTYDKLIIATGARAFVPPIKGLPAKNVFTLKTIPDTDKILNYIDKYTPNNATVIGAGFIGLEAVEALFDKKLNVTLVELLPQVLPPLDPEMAYWIENHLRTKNINLILGDGIKEFITENNSVSSIILNSNRKIDTDMAILSIGVRPEIELAREAGLLIGESGGIVTNESMQTSDPDIYAAGDVCEIINIITNKPARIPLAGPANKAGRVCGANASGGKLNFKSAIGTAIVKTLGIAAAKTGLSEREAKNNGLDYFTSFTHSFDHATYYPGAEMMHIKLIVEKNTGKLLGAQIIGSKGVDKRIDVLATAIYSRLTVFDLEVLDLAYAPQFGSAKDPVNIAGSVAANIIRGELKSMTPYELNQDEDIQLIDVRTPAEYKTGTIPGAISIPLDELRNRLEELDTNKKTVVFCKIGLRGYIAYRILTQNGFKDIYNLSGGILTYLTIGGDKSDRENTR